MRTIKNLVKILLESFQVLGGIFYYIVSRKNSPKAYHAFIRLHCLTKGHSTAFLARAFKLFSPAPKTLLEAQGAWGKFTAQDTGQIADDVRQNGFHVYKELLPEKLINEVMDFALRTPSLLKSMDGEAHSSKPRIGLYNPAKIETVRYDYRQDDLIKEPAIWKLATDPMVVNIARDYLGVEPILDAVRMWWHTDFLDKPDGEAAQLYHFDMERVKWLKFFVYITDVTKDSGPHCFIQRTHVPQSIPDSLLKRGYARITDEEISEHYSKDRIIEFVGPKGTLIAEDTCGLHKGKHVTKGHRLVLQFEYTISMWGPPGQEKAVAQGAQLQRPQALGMMQ